MVVSVGMAVLEHGERKSIVGWVNQVTQQIVGKSYLEPVKGLGKKWEVIAARHGQVVAGAGGEGDGSCGS